MYRTKYAYDHGQRWVRKTLDTDADGTIEESRMFVHDDGQIVLDFEKTGTAAASNSDLAHRYLWGNSVDQLLADETVDDGSEDDVAYTLTDHLNSVRDLVVYNPITQTVSVVKHVTYDAFGNVTSDSATAVKSLFLYTARPFDADTDLQNNLNRWYDLSTGRWMSVDPIGFLAGDVNLYRYAKNCAMMAIDPTGLATVGDDSIDPHTTINEQIIDILFSKIRGFINLSNAWRQSPVIYQFFDTGSEMSHILGTNKGMTYEKIAAQAIRENPEHGKPGCYRVSFSNFDPKLKNLRWRSDRLFDTGFWLNGAHHISVSGSFVLDTCLKPPVIKSVDATWTWYDEIDARSVAQWWGGEVTPLIQDGTIWDELGSVIAGLPNLIIESVFWDLVFDKLIDTDFKVIIHWHHIEANYNQRIGRLPQ